MGYTGGLSNRQVVELLGRNLLATALIRDGLEVARPERDRGIDLIGLFAIEGVAGSCRSVGGSLSGVVEVFQNGGSLRQPLWRPRPCATLPLLVLT